MATFPITVSMPRTGPTAGEPGKSVVVEMPCVPRVGEHFSHEASGVSGYVAEVDYWFPEGQADSLSVSIRLR